MDTDNLMRDILAQAEQRALNSAFEFNELLRKRTAPGPQRAPVKVVREQPRRAAPRRKRRSR